MILITGASGSVGKAVLQEASRKMFGQAESPDSFGRGNFDLRCVFPDSSTC